MSFPASGRCFYCSNPINLSGLHVYADIRHVYKNGTDRESERHFHSACFQKFKVRGRPFYPRTEYEVVSYEEVRGE